MNTKSSLLKISYKEQFNASYPAPYIPINSESPPSPFISQFDTFRSSGWYLRKHILKDYSFCLYRLLTKYVPNQHIHLPSSLTMHHIH